MYLVIIVSERSQAQKLMQKMKKLWEQGKDQGLQGAERGVVYKGT